MMRIITISQVPITNRARTAAWKATDALARPRGGAEARHAPIRRHLTFNKANRKFRIYSLYVANYRGEIGAFSNLP